MSTLAPIQPPRCPLSTLLAGMADAAPAVDVADVAIDSRRVGRDSLFLAYPGTRTHGLEHAAEAVNFISSC